MKNKNVLLCGILLLGSIGLTACASKTEEITIDAQVDSLYHVIELADNTATIDGNKVEEFDYTWHIDPSSEKEWYEGTEPDADAGVYIARDIIYYPMLDEEGFSLEKYDGENEWVYHYTKEGLTDYIFATLPYLGDELPTSMMHTAEEAYNNPVLHITEPGTYVLKGEWNGQILVDLGDEDETFADSSAKVEIILENVDVTCTVAPAIIFDDLYECDNTWEERDSSQVYTSTDDAGAKVVIASGTNNTFTGSNVYRLLKAEYKKNSTSVQKKAHKMDGAFYSFVTMNIEGDDTGILNIRSTTFEGMGSELHLNINGGNINVYSQDDAINVNEDDVSVFTMNGGTLHIFAGLGAEGDGIDSNGYIVVNGGIIAGGTPSGSDSLLDSDCGNTINGGEVITIGSKGFEGMRQFDGMERPDFENKGEGQRPGFGTWEEGQRPDFGTWEDGQRPDFGKPEDGEKPDFGMPENGEMPDMVIPGEEVKSPEQETVELQTK